MLPGTVRVVSFGGGFSWANLVSSAYLPLKWALYEME